MADAQVRSGKRRGEFHSIFFTFKLGLLEEVIKYVHLRCLHTQSRADSNPRDGFVARICCSGTAYPRVTLN